MNKKFILPLILVSALVFSACTTKKSVTVGNSVSDTSIAGVIVKQKGNCQPVEVSIEGYSDKGKMLANCFIEYPDEPTRQDKSHYIVEDICGQFTDKLISNALGKNIIKTVAPQSSSLYNCSYYLDDKEYVMLVLDYLPIANQKTGQESMGRKTVEDPKIPMKNMVVYQEDGQINSIYLVLGDNKFISIQRSSGSVFTSDELINFAIKIGDVIKNYK